MAPLGHASHRRLHWRSGRRHRHLLAGAPLCPAPRARVGVCGVVVRGCSHRRRRRPQVSCACPCCSLRRRGHVATRGAVLAAPCGGGPADRPPLARAREARPRAVPRAGRAPAADVAAARDSPRRRTTVATAAAAATPRTGGAGSRRVSASVSAGGARAAAAGEASGVASLREGAARAGALLRRHLEGRQRQRGARVDAGCPRAPRGGVAVRLSRGGSWRAPPQPDVAREGARNPSPPPGLGQPAETPSARCAPSRRPACSLARGGRGSGSSRASTSGR